MKSSRFSDFEYHMLYRPEIAEVGTERKMFTARKGRTVRQITEHLSLF